MSLPDPAVLGLPLSQWADVEAAVAEGEALDVALRPLGWPRGRYKKAATAWKARLVADPPLLDAYAAHRAAAEDRRERGIAPIADDLPAWIGFLKAYEGAPDAGPFLRGIGLLPADLARLSRRWRRRLDAEPALAKQAASLAAANPPPPLPPLVVTPGVLPAPATVPSDSPAPSRREAPWDVFRWATLTAELRVFAAQREDVLERHGLSETRREALSADFEALFLADPLLAADHRRLLAHAELRLRNVVARAAERGSPPSVRRPPSPSPSAQDRLGWAPAPAPEKAPAGLVGTADLSALVPRAAVPFSPAPPTAPPAPARPVVVRDKASPGTGTAFLPDQAKLPTMPFRAPPGLTSTAPSLGPKGPALPFAPATEKSPSPSSSPPPAAKPKSPSLGQTAPAREAPKEALPFGKAKKSPLARTNMNLAVPREMFAAKAPSSAPPPSPSAHPPAPPAAPSTPPAAPSTPPAAPSTPPPALPMPLERHASLHAELATYPDRRAAVLARYQLDEKALSEVDRRFKQRFAEAPELHRQWHHAYGTYAAWLASRR